MAGRGGLEPVDAKDLGHAEVLEAFASLDHSEHDQQAARSSSSSLPGADLEQATKLAEELRVTVAAVDSGGHSVTASLGVAASSEGEPFPGTTPSSPRQTPPDDAPIRAG